MTKLFRALPYILLVLNLLFIFGNSALPGASSNAVSKKAEQAIEQVVGKDIENDPYEVAMYGKTFNNFLRKCAHAVEFFTLGVLAYICYRRLDKKSLAFAAVLTGVCVPLLDETIQIFSGRTSKVSDMWIDISGFGAGFLLMLAIHTVIYLFRKKRQVK